MILARNRAGRYAVIALGVLAVLLLVVVLFPWNALRGPIASVASERLHRPVTIGHLAVDLGWNTRVQLDQVSIGNAAWSQTQPMATLPSVVLTFRLPSLFRLSPDTTRLVEPDVVLERDAAGEANWNFDGDTGASPAAIGAIDIDRGVVRYRDAMLPANVDVTLQTTPATATAPQTLQFGGRGTFRG